MGERFTAARLSGEKDKGMARNKIALVGAGNIYPIRNSLGEQPCNLRKVVAKYWLLVKPQAKAISVILFLRNFFNISVAASSRS